MDFEVKIDVGGITKYYTTLTNQACTDLQHMKKKKQTLVRNNKSNLYGKKYIRIRISKFVTIYFVRINNKD